MLVILKRLALGVVLIVLASAVLLLSDLNRRTHGARGIPRVGLLQHASTMLLDDAVRGMVDGLTENGFVDGKTIVIRKYNAQGDIAVANSIAKEMVNADFDLLLTSSTLSLQAVAESAPVDKLTWSRFAPPSLTPTIVRVCVVGSRKAKMVKPGASVRAATRCEPGRTK